MKEFMVTVEIHVPVSAKNEQDAESKVYEVLGNENIPYDFDVIQADEV